MSGVLHGPSYKNSKEMNDAYHYRIGAAQPERMFKYGNNLPPKEYSWLKKRENDELNDKFS